MVSSSAKECPSCGTKHFKGVNCALCNEILKFSEAHVISGEYPVHSYCCSKEKRHIPEDGRVSSKISCPTCKNNFPIKFVPWIEMGRPGKQCSRVEAGVKNDDNTLKFDWRFFSQYERTATGERRSPVVSDSDSCSIRHRFSSGINIYRLGDEFWHDWRNGALRVFTKDNPEYGYYVPFRGEYGPELDLTCPKCGNDHLEMRFAREDDPYASCYICLCRLDKKNALTVTTGLGPVWIHKGECHTAYNVGVAVHKRAILEYQPREYKLKQEKFYGQLKKFRFLILIIVLIIVGSFLMNVFHSPLGFGCWLAAIIVWFYSLGVHDGAW
ncbi:MAG: hypothetical protein WCO45_15480 [Pseudanabaena sp. ELA607]|jgi:hypothetical protein